MYEKLFSVKDKVALVTGGTRGIGLMIAEGLVRCGAKTYISSRKEDACHQAERTLSEYGDCTAIPCDISSIEGCRTLASEIAKRESTLHILVNNAGLTWGAQIDDFPEKAWDRVMDLDAKSPFFLTQALLKLLRTGASAEARASVVNISSVNAIRPSGLQNYSYVAAKAGLQGMSVQMARDPNKDNIHVNVIAPGPFKSKMTAPLYQDEETEKAVMASFVMGRWGSLEDIAGLTIYLSSRAGSFVTGTVIPCDGGSTTIG